MFGALIGAAIGGIGSYFAGQDEARAARNQARAIQQASMPSPNELKAIDTLIASRETVLNQFQASIAQNRDLLNSIDPALKAAGEEALKMIQGKESSALAPMRAERERQRKIFENQMAERLGPGWRTSSAGIEASLRFDDQTSLLLEQAQQSSLNSLLGVAAGSRPDTSRDAALMGQFSNASAETQFGMANRLQNRIASAAGLEFEADKMEAQNTAALFGTIGNVSTSLLGNSVGASKVAADNPSRTNNFKAGSNPASTFGDLMG